MHYYCIKSQKNKMALLEIKVLLLSDFSGLWGFSQNKIEIVIMKKPAAHKFYSALFSSLSEAFLIFSKVSLRANCWFFLVLLARPHNEFLTCWKNSEQIQFGFSGVTHLCSCSALALRGVELRAAHPQDFALPLVLWQQGLHDQLLQTA